MKGTSTLNRFVFLRSSEIARRGRIYGLLALALLLPASVPASSQDRYNPTAGELGGKACDIYEDASGIPHVHTGDELEAIACLGYLHGRDRAFQMDFLRRIAEGRVAELKGIGSIKDDFMMRILGISEFSESLFNRMSAEQRRLFWAYSHGVNRGLEEALKKGVYEFKSYGYAPEPWRPVNSIEILLIQSFDQTRRSFTRELEEAEWVRQYGSEAADLFARTGLPWDTTVLKPGEYRSNSIDQGPSPAGKKTKRKSKAKSKIELAKPLGKQTLLEHVFESSVGEGSNNWVVAASRSATGHAWFANDPHLSLKRPSYWYWAHLSAASDIDVIGATLPGVPAVVSGNNRFVAWGLTNAYYDVADLSLVPKKELKDTVVYRPTVWTKFAFFKFPFVFKTFRRTKEGWPILPLDGAPKGKAMVLRWSGYAIEPRDIEPLFQLAHVRSVTDMDHVLSGVGVPSWNFVFADTQGAIGYRAVGRLPKWPGPAPFGVVERSASEMTPWEYLTPDEAPHVLMPARGYIATANNQHWPTDAVLDGGRAYASSFRAFRIEELLNRTRRHDLASLKKVQCDVQAVDARFFVPHLLRALRDATDREGPLSSGETAVIDKVSSWDFEASLRCEPCAVFTRWMERLYIDRHLNAEALYRKLVSSADRDVIASQVLQAFRDALSDLDVPADGTLRPWNEMHRNPFTHFSDDERFATDSIATPGSENSVNPGTAKFDAAKKRYVHFQGASQRLIVEMSSPPAVYSVLPGTDRDDPSPDITDENGPWKKWSRCELEKREFPVDWSRVETHRVSL